MKFLKALGAAACMLLVATAASALTPRLDSLQIVGGSRYQTVKDAKADAQGNLYLFGETTSTDFPASRRIGPGVPSDNASDLFVTKLRISDWSVVYSVVIGGSGEDRASALAIDASGNAYLAGITQSFDFPVTPGALGVSSSLHSPLGAVFFAKLSSDGQKLSYAGYLDFTTETDDRVNLAVDDQGHAYLTGVSNQYFPVTAGSLFSPASNAARLPYLAKMRADGSGHRSRRQQRRYKHLRDRRNPSYS